MLNPPDFRDFPSFHTYQVARKAELTRTRIISLRANNRHLSHREIAYHTGVSVQHVTDVLGEPPAPEGMRLF
jgi:DNA-binding transcriptional regulator YiaG